jgi:hypothetical protein
MESEMLPLLRGRNPRRVQGSVNEARLEDLCTIVWGHFSRKMNKGERRFRFRSGSAEAKSIMVTHHIGLVIYLAFGLFGFISIGGLGAKREGEKKTPLWRKLMAIVFWPLAVIGAIEG